MFNIFGEYQNISTWGWELWNNMPYLLKPKWLVRVTIVLLYSCYCFAIGLTHQLFSEPLTPLCQPAVCLCSCINSSGCKWMMTVTFSKELLQLNWVQYQSSSISSGYRFISVISHWMFKSSNCSSLNPLLSSLLLNAHEKAETYLHSMLVLLVLIVISSGAISYGFSFYPKIFQLLKIYIVVVIKSNTEKRVGWEKTDRKMDEEMTRVVNCCMDNLFGKCFK